MCCTLLSFVPVSLLGMCLVICYSTLAYFASPLHLNFVLWLTNNVSRGNWKLRSSCSLRDISNTGKMLKFPKESSFPDV